MSDLKSFGGEKMAWTFSITMARMVGFLICTTPRVKESAMVFGFFHVFEW